MLLSLIDTYRSGLVSIWNPLILLFLSDHHLHVLLRPDLSLSPQICIPIFLRAHLPDLHLDPRSSIHPPHLP